MSLIESSPEAASLPLAVALELVDTPRDGIRLLERASRTVARLHRREAYHGGLSPAAFHLGCDGRLRVDRRRSSAPAYRAPEQLLGLSWGDPRGDVWALGVILFEWLTGHRPFPGDTAAEVRDAILSRSLPPELPATSGLGAICRKALHKLPHRRYDTADALAAALARTRTQTA